MSFLDRLLGRESHEASGGVAKDRLKLVLEYDRARLTPAQLEEIRADIVEAISRHVDISQKDVEVSLQQGGRLVAEIPLERITGEAG